MAHAGIALRQRVAPTGAIVVWPLGNPRTRPYLGSNDNGNQTDKEPQCLRAFQIACPVSSTG